METIFFTLALIGGLAAFSIGFALFLGWLLSGDWGQAKRYPDTLPLWGESQKGRFTHK